MKVCVSTIIQEKTLTSMFYLMEKEFSKHWSMLVRGRLDKVNSSSLAIVLRQPIFKNIQILSCAWVGHSRLVIEVKGDPWQSKESPNRSISRMLRLRHGKQCPFFGLQKHPSNVLNRDKIIFIYVFFWKPNFAPTTFHIKD